VAIDGGEGRKSSSEFYSVYSVFSLFGIGVDFSVVCSGQNASPGRICSLFSNAYQLPKLDVAGSTPVSRSIFSVTYRDSRITAITAKALNAVTARLYAIENNRRSEQNVNP
jgi:hypothetical protein